VAGFESRNRRTRPRTKTALNCYLRLDMKKDRARPKRARSASGRRQ
jgi:hypothetical protein